MFPLSKSYVHACLVVSHQPAKDFQLTDTTDSRQIQHGSYRQVDAITLSVQPAEILVLQSLDRLPQDATKDLLDFLFPNSEVLHLHFLL